jgi:hypothetical protein
MAAGEEDKHSAKRHAELISKVTGSVFGRF